MRKSQFSLFPVIVSAFIISCSSESEEIAEITLSDTDPSVCSDSIYTNTIPYAIFKAAERPYLETEPLGEVCHTFKMNSVEDLNKKEHKQLLMNYISEKEFKQLTRTDFTQQTVVFFCMREDNKTINGEYATDINLKFLGICQTSDDADALPFNELIFQKTGCLDPNATENEVLNTYILITERRNEKPYGSTTEVLFSPQCE